MSQFVSCNREQNRVKKTKKNQQQPEERRQLLLLRQFVTCNESKHEREKLDWDSEEASKPEL